MAASGLQAQEASGAFCATDLLHQELIEQNPQLAEEMEAQEQHYRAYVQENMSRDISTRTAGINTCEGIVYIPVVVHVVHLGEPVGTGSNMSDVGINSAITGLNQKLRNQNGFGVDMKMQFVLAKRDPQGNSTTGIQRVDGSGVTDFATEGITSGGSEGANEMSVKNLSIWPRQDYYNIWVVHDIAERPGVSGQIGGYAYLPMPNNQRDGAVIDVNFMTAGSDVLVHEIGHGFNLRHTFQGDNNNTACPSDNDCLNQGDFVCDTPPHRQTDCGSGNPCTSSGTWNSSRRNYMSYCNSTDRFTDGQQLRVEAAIFGNIRSSLLESEAIIPVNQPREIGILEMLYPSESINEPICGSNFIPRVSVKNYGTDPITQLIMIPKVDGIATGSFNFSGTLPPGSVSPITLNPIAVPSGNHSFEIEIVVVNGSAGDAYTDNNKACGSFTFDNRSEFPYCNDFESVAKPTGWQFDNPETEVEVMEVTLDGVQSKSLAFNNYDAISGSLQKESNIFTQVLDLTAAQSAGISFDISMRETFICNTPITLDVAVSTDCGENFTSLYNRNNARSDCPGYAPSAFPLHTVPRPPDTNPPFESFEPNSSNQWRNDFINLSDYAGQEIVVRFQVTTEFFNGENIYLDNVCVVSCNQASPMTIQFDAVAANDSNGIARATVSGGQAPYRYIWDINPDNSVDSISNLAPGNYSLTVVDAVGCITTDEVTIGDNTGIAPLPPSLTTWKVYPNPFSLDFTVDLAFEQMTSLQLALFDFQGRKVWKLDAGNVIQFNYSIPTHALSEGIYFLSAQTPEGILRIPVIKRH